MEKVQGLVLMAALFMMGKRGAIRYREELGQLLPLPSCRVPILEYNVSEAFI